MPTRHELKELAALRLREAENPDFRSLQDFGSLRRKSYYKGVYMFNSRLRPSRLLYVALIAAGVLLAVFAAAPARAEYPAAPVNSFNGEIIVLPASQPLPAQRLASSGAPAILTYSGDVRVVSSPQPTVPHSLVGLPLPDGYRVVTPPRASATLTLPDGSQIQIREMSIVELNGFAWNPQARLRGMLMSLYAGSVRVTMAPAYREQGSFFEVKTPNALVALHFSQPDVEVIYATAPLEQMAALLEEGVTLEAEEEALWSAVLSDRKEDVARRQSERRARAQIASLPNDGAPLRPTTATQLLAQEAFTQIGLIQSEEDALLQARLLQRNEDATGRFPTAIQRQDAAAQPPDASTSGLVLPMNLDLEQWQNDGLIIGEDETGKGATFVFAYNTSAIFMNRLTRETRTVQPGQRALVRGLGVTMTVMNGSPMEQDPPRNMGTVFALDSQGQAPSLNNPDESAILGQGDDDSRLPGSSGRSESLSNRPRPHQVEITIAE